MDEERVLIGVINKLQTCKSFGIKVDHIRFPQIVVVGSQSSGKSSVLDGLIGYPLLPRGTGTVTKCPIVVQLIHTEKETEKGVTFLQDMSSTPELIGDFQVAGEMIKKKMDDIKGAITHEPIVLQVYSPDVVNLTVVDMPGIKKLASGKEPSDIEKKLLKISETYIRQQDVIILAVSAANSDISNSDGVVLAKIVDPHGERTLGVLTKLDIMDKGTDARELLTGIFNFQNGLPNLKLGMIGLVNRSQKSIVDNLSLEEQFKKEKAFLKKTYPDLAHRNGMPYLRKRLQEILVQSILRLLPSIKEKIFQLKKDCVEKLRLVPEVPETKDKRKLLESIISKFERNFNREVEGSIRNPESEYVFGGIKIREIFEKDFPSAIIQSGNVPIEDKVVLNAFQNSGTYDTFFTNPEAVFRRLTTQKVGLIEEPTLHCAHKVYEIIKDIMSHNLELLYELKMFPKLQTAIKSEVEKMIDLKYTEVQKAIRDYLEDQKATIFSLDKKLLEDLSDLRRDIERLLHGESETGNGPMKVTQPAAKPTQAIIDPVKRMVGLYYMHTMKQCQEYVPKLIARRLINQFSGEGYLGNELRLRLYEECDKMFQLPMHVQEEKKRNEYLLKKLEAVISDLNGIQQTHRFDENHNHLGSLFNSE